MQLNYALTMLEDNEFLIFQTRFFGLPAPTLIVHIDPLVPSQSAIHHLEEDMSFLKTSSSIATRIINNIHTAPIFSSFLDRNCCDSPDINLQIGFEGKGLTGGYISG